MFSSHLHRWNFQLLAARGQSWPARAVFQGAFLIYDKCNFCCTKCHFSWIETNIIGGGRRAKYKKNIYWRKGKLNEKNLCTPINPKKYSCYGLKLKFMKQFDNEKNFRGAKIPPPPNSSNGPSLIDKRDLKQRRFWAKHVNRKWGLLPFYMPWR